MLGLPARSGVQYPDYVATSTLADLYAMDPVEFERLVGTVFTALGYDVKVTKRSGDEGIDLELRRGDERSLAQCKRYRGTVGQPEIRDFYGALMHENAARGYFVTTGQFSLAASTWAQGKPIALTDGVDLLAALENAGIVPEPRAKEHLGGTPTRLGLEVVVKAALRHRESSGQVLIDGAPPNGHTYRELADYLEHCFPGQTDKITSSKLKGGRKSKYSKTPLEAWLEADARVRLVDEFDGLARSAMESILEAQRDGIRNTFRPWHTLPAGKRLPGLGAVANYDGQQKHKRLWEISRHRFVLVATAWEKRLPSAVRARFATVIPVHELDWSAFKGHKKA